MCPQRATSSVYLDGGLQQELGKLQILSSSSGSKDPGPESNNNSNANQQDESSQKNDVRSTPSEFANVSLRQSNETSQKQHNDSAHESTSVYAAKSLTNEVSSVPVHANANSRDESGGINLDDLSTKLKQCIGEEFKKLKQLLANAGSAGAQNSTRRDSLHSFLSELSCKESTMRSESEDDARSATSEYADMSLAESTQSALPAPPKKKKRYDEARESVSAYAAEDLTNEVSSVPASNSRSAANSMAGKQGASSSVASVAELMAELKQYIGAEIKGLKQAWSKEASDGQNHNAEHTEQSSEGNNSDTGEKHTTEESNSSSYLSELSCKESAVDSKDEQQLHTAIEIGPTKSN